MSDPDITTIRVSSLSAYSDCPRRSAARLFWKEIKAAGFRLNWTARGIGAVIGSAVHKAAEITLREKAVSGTLPPLTVALDAATGSLNQGMREGVEFDGSRGATHNQREAESQTISMASAYHRTVAPSVEPVIVEERLIAAVAPGVVLSGQPDVVAREPHRVRDLKSGARKPSSFAAQLGGYSLLARSHKLDIESAAIDFIQRVPVSKPQPVPLQHSIPIATAETAAANILRHIVDDLRVFRNGDAERRILPGDPWAFVANPSSTLCSARWCPAFGTSFCHEGDVNKGEPDA